MLIDCMRLLFVQSDNVLASYSTCYVCILDNDYRSHDNHSSRLRKPIQNSLSKSIYTSIHSEEKRKNQYESLVFLDKNFEITDHDDNIRLYVIIKIRNEFVLKFFYYFL